MNTPPKNLKILYIILYLISFKIDSIQADEVNVYLDIFPQTVEVTKLSTVHEAIVSNHITEGLFEIGKSNKVINKLVKDYRWLNDGKILELTFRDKYFSDGTKLNSTHVINSLKACVKSPGGRTSLSLSKVLGFKKFLSNKSDTFVGLKLISNKKIAILLNDSSPLIIDELAMKTCNIWKGKSDLINGGIGTGPYKLFSHSENKITLIKSKYDKRTLGPDKINFYSQGVQGIAFDLYVDNKFEFDKSKFRQYQLSDLLSHHLVLNNSIPPFDNKKLRKLIENSINYSIVAKYLHINANRLQGNLFPLGIRGFKQREGLAINVNKLRSDFKNLGYSDSHKLSFDLFIRDTREGKKETPLWIEVFKGLPIKVNVKYTKVNNLFNQKLNKKFHAMRVGKGNGALDPFRLISSYHSLSPWNTTHSRIKECDNLIASALKISDREERYSRYIEADKCLIEKNQILIPLGTYKQKKIYLNKKWKFLRNNRYLLYPYRIYEWVKND